MPNYNPKTKGQGHNYKWLLAHVSHNDDACLIWPFSRNNTGYGQLGYLGKMRKAHRFMCELAHGEPPSPKHEASHSCGNGMRGCVNPRHLGWKTRSENQLDRRRHGTAKTNKWGAGGKLSEADKAEIRALRGKMTQAKMALKFGVHFETISRILRTPPDRPRAFIPWQPHEDAHILANQAAGRSAKQILIDGRSPSSIASRLRRLNGRTTDQYKDR